jgi:hypothetical protein
MRRLGAAVYLLIMLGAVTGSAEPAQEALREMVRAHVQKFPGKPLTIGQVVDPQAKTVAELTREAKVVFHARLFKVKSYVWKNGETILTDYAIREQQLLAARSDTAIIRATDISKPLIVTVWGGEVTVDGVKVRATTLNEDTIVEGGEYVLFLKPSRAYADQYEPYNAGIFAIRDGKVRPTRKDSEYLFKDAFDAPVATLLSTISKARLR